MPALANAKHEKFAQAIAKGVPAGKAYADAGYKPSDANATRLKSNDKIKARVQELIDLGAVKAEVSIARVLEELSHIAFADIRNAVKWGISPGDVSAANADPNGLGIYPVRLIPSEKIDDSTAKAVAEVSLTAQGVKVKMHDKLSALDKLAKHLGMFVERHEVTGKDGKPIETRDTSREAIAKAISELPEGDRDAIRALVERLDK